MSKYKLDKSVQVVENQNYIMTQEEVCERLNDLEAKLAEKEVDILALDTDNYSFKQQIDSLKQQLADTEAQNKRVLEKLDLIVRSNQELEQQLAEKDAERELDNSFWKQECDSLQKALAEKEEEIKQLNMRKEVVQEIRKIADIDDWEEINGYTLGKILDQIQGENK